jgi:hypothetical protein
MLRLLPWIGAALLAILMYVLKFGFNWLGDALHAHDDWTGLGIFMLFGAMFVIICYLVARLIDQRDNARLSAQQPPMIDLPNYRVSERAPRGAPTSPTKP